MEGLLSPVSTTYYGLDPIVISDERHEPRRSPKSLESTHTLDSLEDALHILKAQPGYDDLIGVLKFIVKSGKVAGSRSRGPSPQSAAIIRVLITEIVPNYWILLSEGTDEHFDNRNGNKSTDAGLLVSCFKSPVGLNAIVTHLDALNHESKAAPKDSRRSDLEILLGIYLDLLSAMLKGDTSLTALWDASGPDDNHATRRIQSQALLSLIASGRILSIAAEALKLRGIWTEQKPSKALWIATGADFVRWVASNIAAWTRSKPSKEALLFCSSLFQKALSLGHSGE